MDKIVCLVGESASGKTTIAKELEKENYNIIHSYTTREPREENEWGHKFVDELPYNLSIYGDWNGVIAHTYYNDNYYWATKKQYQNKGTSIYVIDPAGVKTIKEKVDDAKIIVIYLKSDRKTREHRLFKREGYNPLNLDEYREVLEKLDYDKDKFSLVECDYVVDANRTVKEILEDIKEVIK